MKIKLIEGNYNSNDAFELISKMIETKIKFHENKISQDCSEEDIKYRESKIKSLQQELLYFKTNYTYKNGTIDLNSVIELY